MKRTIKKQFWFSRDEAQDLQKKAKKEKSKRKENRNYEQRR